MKLNKGPVTEGADGPRIGQIGMTQVHFVLHKVNILATTTPPLSYFGPDRSYANDGYHRIIYSQRAPFGTQKCIFRPTHRINLSIFALPW